MRDIQPPQLLGDLYRDLRDRRLLPVALLLLAALVAVPVVLSSSSASTPAAPVSAPATASEEDSIAQPAVLAEDFGIRDYSKRLEQFKTKNPFRQQFQLPEVTSSTLTEGPIASTDATSSTSESTDDGGSASTGTATSTTSSTPDTSDPIARTDTQRELVTHRIDVRVGPSGDLQEREGVKQLSLLPSKGTPVVAFLGASEDGKRALFLVSGDVSAVSGDGRCLPSPSSCSYLTLKEGEQASFDYTPDATTYELRLEAIREVLLKRD
jgi:hypothetical protein